jgi:hypothetical protein
MSYFEFSEHNKQKNQMRDNSKDVNKLPNPYVRLIVMFEHTGSINNNPFKISLSEYLSYLEVIKAKNQDLYTFDAYDDFSQKSAEGTLNLEYIMKYKVPDISVTAKEMEKAVGLPGSRDLFTMFRQLQSKNLKSKQPSVLSSISTAISGQLSNSVPTITNTKLEDYCDRNRDSNSCSCYIAMKAQINQFGKLYAEFLTRSDAIDKANEKGRAKYRRKYRQYLKGFASKKRLLDGVKNKVGLSYKTDCCIAGNSCGCRPSDVWKMTHRKTNGFLRDCSITCKYKESYKDTQLNQYTSQNKPNDYVDILKGVAPVFAPNNNCCTNVVDLENGDANGIVQSCYQTIENSVEMNQKAEQKAEQKAKQKEQRQQKEQKAKQKAKQKEDKKDKKDKIVIIVSGTTILLLLIMVAVYLLTT